MATEDRFPTIRDLRDRLSDLVNVGLGDLPVQVLIIPDSTMRAVARMAAPDHPVQDDKPPLMIEFGGGADRLPATLVSCAFLEGERMPTGVRQ